MSDPLEKPEIQPRKADLLEAIRRVRLVSTEQADGLADLRDAERARLELLADGLTDLLAELPDDLDFFAFALSQGETLRLWIDMTCHVALGRDRRTYRLLKDTRLGRTVIFESADRDEMVTRITDYVAERVLDRQRAIEGDWIELRARDRTAGLAAPIALKQPEPGDAANEDAPSLKSRRLAHRRTDGAERSNSDPWAAFIIGLLIGAGALAGWMVASGRL
jgi:hypothetical protein